MNDDIINKIETITEVLNSGSKFDSYEEKKRLEVLIEELYKPATDMQTVRFEMLGQSLYATSFEGSNYANGDYSAKRSLPILRASKKKLVDFLKILEELGVLSPSLRHDSMLKTFTESQQKQVMDLAEKVEDSPTGKRKDAYLVVLATLIYEKCMWLLEQAVLPVSINKQVVQYILAHRKEPTGVATIDYTTMGEHLVKKFRRMKEGGDVDIKQLMNEFAAPTISITTSMLYWSESPDTMRKSQKARGIQRIGLTYESHSLWEVEPSLFLSLADAISLQMGELLQSLTACFQGRTVKSILKQGLFIRTCPASPRPGALENVLAHTPVELRDGLRYLAEGMLDEKGSDYDPHGCLCIMPFIQPVCSGVLVKGHRSLVIGPAHDGVTAGGGSNIILTISKGLAGKVSSQITQMKLEDNMDNHELEFVFRKSAGTMYQHISRLKNGSRVIHESLPVITQVRGLHEEKPPLKAPPTVVLDGERHTLHIRGNIPSGSIKQENFIDVGKGDLSDCLELEQMAEKGELPEGLVVYCSAGSPNAHVAGVGVQWDIAVVYCPVNDNGTTWTELDGWVTTLEGVTPSPYDPSLFKEYFIMGCEDGDRFWQYQNQALSQFLHSYINGPMNDARFEAYLGGVYASWILKATLAVAIGEGRHAYTSTKAKYKPIHGLIHIFTSKVLEEPENPKDQSWMDRAWYYHLFQNKEVGLENLLNMFKAYERLFSECKWPGSYGGQNYAESVQKGLAAAKAIHDYQHHNGPFKTVLGTVNTLENAVHNCSFFFNKFIADKKFFDIGTNDHTTMRRLEWQYLVAAGFQYRFYKYRISEPEKISPFYAEEFEKMFVDYKSISDEFILDDVFSMIHETGENDPIIHILEQYPALAGMLTGFTNMHGGGAKWCDDCESNECGCFPSFVNFHHEGACGWSGCTLAECKKTHTLDKYGISTGQVLPLTSLFSWSMPKHKMFNDQPFSFANWPVSGSGSIKVGSDGVIAKEHWETLFKMEIDKTGEVISDVNATVFTETEREKIEGDTPWDISLDNDIFKPTGEYICEIDLPAPIVFKSDSPNQSTIIYAQEALSAIFKFARDRFSGTPTTTLIRDLKEIKSGEAGMYGPLDYDLMEIISLVHDRLAHPDIHLLSSNSMMYLSNTPTIIGYDWRNQTPDNAQREIHLVNLYTNILISIISDRLKENPDHAIYGNDLGEGQSAHTIFEILLSEFDLDFVKEVLQ
mgnify:CR=1 FL=1